MEIIIRFEKERERKRKKKKERFSSPKAIIG